MRKEEKTRILINNIMNKMLEKHNITIDEIFKSQHIDGVAWFDYYTLTQDEFNEWRDWSIKEMRKSLRLTKKVSEQEVDKIAKIYGLKVEDNV